MRQWVSRIAAAVAISAAIPAGAADKVVIGVTPAITYAVAYVAKAEGIFDRNGLNVEFVAGGGSVLVSGVVSGSMQVAGPTLPTILQGIDGGLPYKIIAGLNVPARTHQEYAVVVGNKANIVNANGFVGKTVGVNTLNAMLHVLFQSYLLRNGVDLKSVRFVELPFPQMGDVMKQGTVDAVVSAQPFVNRMVDNKVGSIGPDFMKGLPEGLPLLAFVASDGYVAKNPDVIRRFKVSLKEAEAIVAANPKKAIETSNTFLKMPPAALAHVELPALQLDLDKEKIKIWTEIMKSMSLLQNDIDPKSIVLQN